MLSPGSLLRVLESGMIGLSCSLIWRGMTKNIMLILRCSAICLSFFLTDHWYALLLVLISLNLYQEFDLIFEEFGGFDGLYLRMLSSKIPTVVQLMWIPFLELKIHQQFLLIANLCNQCLAGLWNSPIVSYRRDWLWTKVGNITEDIMMMIVFPVLDNVIPYRVFTRNK